MADTRTYSVDENDPRLTGLTNEGNTEVKKSDAMYDSQIKETDSYTDKQVNAVKNWEKTQTKIQNQQTEFAIDKINQQKDQTHKDYIKEQSGAYTDWQKQSNQYGANAEAMAAQGMGKTGYSESSQVSMYVAYQNRVATARESYNRAVLEYDNAIKEARLANSSALAQIAYDSLQKRLELSLAGFQYKNALIQQKASARREISQDYWSRYNAMYGNIQSENALNESAKHNQVVEENAAAQLQLEKEKFNYSKAQDKLSSNSYKSSGNSGGGGGTAKGKVYKAPKKLDSAKVSKEPKGNKTSKQPTVDTKSVLNLGYGPIGPSKLNSLISEGKVVEYEKNGKLKYKKVFSYR
jgi:hypothetical protein